ncbi:MAG: ABC transporter ATP-binding protein [Planctomycetes bacterium]|nr:ABC transporter ATP-binding protein [Planctomycetota bacterium]
MSYLQIEGIDKSYGAFHAVRSLSLEIEKGDFFVILGPSGCGKTSLLRLIAGLETPDAGTIKVAGELFSSAQKSIPPESRNIGMVFQGLALWPHMSVMQHLDFVLKHKGHSRAVRRQRIDHILGVVSLALKKDNYPGQLSGGEQQRVALARALVSGPRLLLLDEPLSNLDESIRAELSHMLVEVHQETETTTVMVTHHQEEALSCATRLAVMNDGEVAQIGTPEEIYFQPRSAFVATFVGATNVIESNTLTREDFRPLFSDHPGEFDLIDKNATLGIRREEIVVGFGGENRGVKGKVVSQRFIGHKWLLGVDAMGETFSCLSNKMASRGDEVTLKLKSPPFKLESHG